MKINKNFFLFRDSSDDAPFVLQVLQQFRFLEILYDTEFFMTQIEELLSRSPEWFQREILLFIPDIITDSLHHTTSEILIKIMESNVEVSDNVLDCINNLNLGKEFKEELRDKVLELLKTNKNIDKTKIPSFARFVYNFVTNNSNF